MAPRGLAALIAECEQMMHGETRPQHYADVPLFRAKWRRSIDRIAGEFGGTLYSYIWLAIAWAKLKGHVPPGVDRTELSRAISFWTSEVM